MQKGRDVLIVYDDLTHMPAPIASYLLLLRSAGREAFPAIFLYSFQVVGTASI